MERLNWKFIHHKVPLIIIILNIVLLPFDNDISDDIMHMDICRKPVNTTHTHTHTHTRTYTHTHTHTHTNFPDQSSFKKPSAFTQCMPDLKLNPKLCLVLVGLTPGRLADENLIVKIFKIWQHNF